ncbi:MAG: DMT family transporter [Gammaproteobacteria bacterium]|nr:DMT family transporter [Gammaproteobacteria bacterium]
MSVVIAYIAVVLLWGTTPLAVQWSADGVDLVFALGARTLIGLVLTLSFMRWRGEFINFEPRALKLYAVSLLGTVCSMYAIYWSSRYIASGLISVLFGLAPIIGGFFASIWLTERFFQVYKLAGVLCALFGLVIIFHQEMSVGGESWKGVMAAFSGVTLYSLSSVWIKRLGGEYSILSVNAGSLLASFIVLFLIWLTEGSQWPVHASTRSFTAIIYLGVFGSFVGFVSYYYVLRNMEASSALLITLMTPIIALYLGTALNGESLHGSVWFGSVLVLTGLMVYLWSAIKTNLQLVLQRLEI